MDMDMDNQTGQDMSNDMDSQMDHDHTQDLEVIIMDDADHMVYNFSDNSTARSRFRKFIFIIIVIVIIFIGLYVIFGKSPSDVVHAIVPQEVNLDTASSGSALNTASNVSVSSTSSPGVST